MAFLGGLRGLEIKRAGKGDEIERSKSVSHAVAGSASARGGMYSVGGQWDTEKAVTDGYEKVMWIYRCVDAIATNQSSLPIILQKGDGKQGDVRQNPQLWKLLNIRPNDYEDAQAFRYRLSSQGLLSKRGVFIEVVGDIENPESLHLLPPNMCEPIPGKIDENGKMRFVDGYQVRSAEGHIEIMPPEKVIWIKFKPHPLDPYQQMTPLVANGLAIETDFLARLFNRNFLMNDGRPGLLITVKGHIDNTDAEEIKRRFSGGMHQAGQATVVEADGLDVADLSANPRDISWGEMLKGTKEDFLIAFGVPESVLGNASGRTWDNAETELSVFWQNTMIPHNRAFTNGIDRLTGSVDDDTKLVMDYSDIEVLQRAQREKDARADADYSAGLTSWEEWRTARGMNVWDVQGARIITLSNGFVIAENQEDIDSSLEIPNIKTLAPTGPEAPADPTEAARAGAIEGSQQAQRQLGNIAAAASLRQRALALTDGKTAQTDVEIKAGREHGTQAVPVVPDTDDDDDSEPEVIDGEILAEYEDGRIDFEKTMEVHLGAMAVKQSNVIPKRLTHSEARKGTRHWDAGEGVEVKVVRNIDPEYIVEIDRWAADMREDFEAALRPLLRKEANRAARDVEDFGILARMKRQKKVSGEGRTALDRLFNNVQHDKSEMVEKHLAEVLDIIEASVRYQSNKVAKIVEQMDAEGKTIKQIQDAVRTQIGVRSKWRRKLAVGMATTAIEGVRASVYGMTGRRIKKTWNTRQDERVRHSHEDMEGITLSSTTAFTVGPTKAKMQRPGDPAGPMNEVAGCRCFLSYQLT